MKNLIAVAALGLALGFSSLSFASDYMELYTKPIVKSEVKNEVRGGYVEKDHISFYLNPKDKYTVSLNLRETKQEDEGSYIVFGVRVPVKPTS